MPVRVALVALLLAVAVEARAQGDRTLPSVISKGEPQYTEEALNARVVGQVWLSVTIDKTGNPVNPTIAKSLGFGLDQSAMTTVRTWRFMPATRNGSPIDYSATVAVRFHLTPSGGRDFQGELRKHLSDLHKTGDPGKAAKIAGRIENLSDQSFPAAMHEYAKLLRDGKVVPRNGAGAYELILDAAKAGYGPAIWDVTQRDIATNGGDPYQENMHELIVKAAELGSSDAQYFMGRDFEEGTGGYDTDIAAARHMYLACATAGNKECQYRVGRLLLLQTGRNEDDICRAVAWLELAQEHGVNDARVYLQMQALPLSGDARKKIKSFKKRFGQPD